MTINLLQKEIRRKNHETTNLATFSLNAVVSQREVSQNSLYGDTLELQEHTKWPLLSALVLSASWSS
jgi:hypothetical protein